MNREILFRAMAINRQQCREYRTNYKNGDWVYGLITRHEDVWDCAKMTNEDGISNIDVAEQTLGQYTGLTDKNGTKIFEGDIVELCCIRTYCGRQVSRYDKPTKVRVVIKFGECPNGFGIGFNFDYNNKFNEKVCEPIGKEQGNREIWKRSIGEFITKEYKKEITHPNWIWKNHFEVIGNIHDSPELLEGIYE